MQFRRQSTVLLYAVFVLVASAGCAGTGMSSVQRTAPGPSEAAPERLVSIAQMFERQGRMQQADSMYRMALRRDPDNETALRQIEYIASLQKAKTFGAPDGTSAQESDVQLAVNDQQTAVPVRPAASQKKPRFHQRPPQVAHQNQPTAESLAAEARASLMKTLLPAIEPTVRPAETVAVAGVARLRPANSDSSLKSVERPAPESASSESAASETAASEIIITAPAAVTPLVTAEQRAVQQHVAASLVKQQQITPKSPVHQPPTMQLIASWMEAPSEHVDSLLRTLRTGSDDEQRALAATLLAEVPAKDQRVNSALREHLLEQNAAVAVASGDSLLARDAATDTVVGALMSLATHADSEIRIQVLSSMRRLCGTRWENQAAGFLAAGLNDDDPTVRSMAALTLGDFSSEADVIVEYLCDRYQTESDVNVQIALELAARRIAVLPEDENQVVRKKSAAL